MKIDSSDCPPSSAEAIAGVIGRYHTSGLALKDFARQEGLPLGRLHYWLYQKHRARASRGLSRREGVAGVPVFQEVKLTADPPAVTSWAVEVSLPRGGVARFSGAASPEWIGQVVQALQRP